MENKKTNVGKEVADKQHQNLRLSPGGQAANPNRPPVPQGPPPQRPRPEMMFEIRSITIESDAGFVMDRKNNSFLVCFNADEKKCSANCAAFARQRKEKPDDKKQICQCALMRMPIGVVEE